MVLAYILFFLAGLGFGYAAPGNLKYIPFAFPVVLALGALIRDGLQGEIILRLVVALVLTGAGILLGRLLEGRFEQDERPTAS